MKVAFFKGKFIDIVKEKVMFRDPPASVSGNVHLKKIFGKGRNSAMVKKLTNLN